LRTPLKETHYENLSEIKIYDSIKCADALNSFNEEIWTNKIDHLINEAICLYIPEYDEAVFNVMTK